MKRPELLWVAQLGLCYLCGAHMEPMVYDVSSCPLGWTRDHLHPVSKGGKLRAGNVLLAHMGCNAARGNAAPTAAALTYAQEMAQVEKAIRLMLDISAYNNTLRGALCALDVLHAAKGVVGDGDWPSFRFEALRRSRRISHLKGMR